MMQQNRPLAGVRGLGAFGHPNHLSPLLGVHTQLARRTVKGTSQRTKKGSAPDVSIAWANNIILDERLEMP